MLSFFLFLMLRTTGELAHRPCGEISGAASGLEAHTSQHPLQVAVDLQGSKSHSLECVQGFFRRQVHEAACHPQPVLNPVDKVSEE